MSSVDPLRARPVVPAARTATARHAVPADGHYVRARRWTVGVLVAGTLALFGYLAMLVVGTWLVGAAIEVVRPGTTSPLDLAGLLRSALPGLLVGWCGGLAALAVLVRGEALGARLTGLASGLVGVVAGATVLALGGLI